MKKLIFIASMFFTSCAYLSIGSNIRSGIIKTINCDTVQFYGSAKKFILIGEVFRKEKIQYTVVEFYIDNRLPTIKKL